MIPYFLSFLSYTYPLRPIACAKTMHISMQDASARWLQQVLTQAKPTVMPTSNNNKSFSAVQPTAQSRLRQVPRIANSMMLSQPTTNHSPRYHL
jgi:hypothetical protein